MYRKKKILIVSDNPLLFSGLARWGREFTLRLIADYEVAYAGWHYHGRKHDYPFFIYPLDRLTSQSYEQLGAIIEDYMPDVVLGLGDLDYFIDFPKIKDAFCRLKCIDFVLHLTVDGNPLNPLLKPVLMCADKVFVCSEFGQRVLKGLAPEVATQILPLGVNPDTFSPSSKRAQLRKTNGFAENKFVVVTNQQNSVRHNLNAVIWAFKAFLERTKADAMLYMNCDTQDTAGPNLVFEAKRAGIEDKVFFGKNTSVLTAALDEDINGLYNIADVLVAASCNEGFGLPVAEAMRCGVIPIATNYASLTELVKGNGILVPPAALLTTPQGIRQAVISHEGLITALEAAYKNFMEDKVGWEAKRQQCIEFAKEYTWSQAAKEIKRSLEKPITGAPGLAKKVGIMTSWNEKCGIAEHNKKYVSQLACPKVVLACDKRSPYEVDVPDEDYVVRCWARTFKDYKALMAEIKKQNIDVLHIHHELSFYEDFMHFREFMRGVRAQGIKIILTLHTVWNINGILGALSEEADMVTVCFNQDVQFLAKADLRYVSNAIEWRDDASKEEARKKLGLPLDKKILVSNGFWQEHKGYYQVIQILPDMIKKDPNLLYIIVGVHGEGHPYYDKVVKLIDELGVKDNVKIVNEYVPDDVLFDYLHSADVCIYNYYVNFQTASAAVLTGMAAHRPVVCTDSPMFSHINNEAYKAKTGDLQHLQKCIEDFLNDPEFGKVMVSRADKLLKQITPDLVAFKYEALYEEVRPWYPAIMKSPDVLIGIPTYNDFARIDAAISSVKANTNTNRTYQLVALDDGTDNRRVVAGLRNICRNQGIPLIEHGENLGIPQSWNDLTTFITDSPYVCLFNDDIQVKDPNWLDTGLYALENNPGVGCVGWPLIQIDKNTGKPNDKFPIPSGDGEVGIVGAAVGCSFMFKRETYNKTQGFWNELVSFYEEIDFGFQMKDMGFESIMLPYPAVEHWGSQTFGSNVSLAVRDVDESILSRSGYLAVLKEHEATLAIPFDKHQDLANYMKVYRMDYSRVMFALKWKTEDKFNNPQGELHQRMYKDRKPTLMKWLDKDMRPQEKEI